MPSFPFKSILTAASAASLLSLSSLAFSADAHNHAEKLKLVATIKPLQLVVSDLVGDLGHVELLLPPGSSPHDFSLKPSHARELAEADLVVWVGEDMERFMVKMLGELDTPHFTMVEAIGVGHDDHEGHKENEEEHHDDHDGHEEHHDDHDAHDAHDDHADEHKDHDAHDDHADEHKDHDEHEDEHDDHEGEAEGGHHDHDHSVDLHYWLDPITVIAFAHELKEVLEVRYPALEAQLDANYHALETAIKAEDKLNHEAYASVKDKGFFAFHDAWGHYVAHYGLNQLGYFTIDPNRRPGAKHLTKIREQLTEKKAACVFTEPQFRQAIVESVTDGLDVVSAEIDPLASDIEAGKNGYARYLQHLRGQFLSCLK